MDNSTLNKIISEAHVAIYPKLFKSSIEIGESGIASIDYDMNVPPTVNLDVSSKIKVQVEEMLRTDVFAATSDLDITDVSAMVDLISMASFGIDLSVELKINYTKPDADPTTAKATLHVVVNVKATTIEGQNKLILKVFSATIATKPPDPILDDLLNKALIPYMIPILNEKFLAPIKIPTLEYESLRVSLPVLAVQSPYALAYSALGSTQPDIPAASTWPSDCVFIGLDSTVLQAAAATKFPLGPGTGFDWEIFSGRAEAQVHAPTHFKVNRDGSVSASITMDALAQLTMRTPWPFRDVSFGPRAHASIAATLKPSVRNGVMYIALEGVPIPTFHFDWGIPSWIDWLFYPLEEGLAAALNGVLGPLIGNVLKFPPIKVFEIPSMEFTLEGVTIKINLDKATTSAKQSLLVIDTQATVVHVD